MATSSFSNVSSIAKPEAGVLVTSAPHISTSEAVGGNITFGTLVGITADKVTQGAADLVATYGFAVRHAQKETDNYVLDETATIAKSGVVYITLQEDVILGAKVFASTAGVTGFKDAIGAGDYAFAEALDAGVTGEQIKVNLEL